jgi:hypothetical protein
MGLPSYWVVLFMPATARDPAGPSSAFACVPARYWSSLHASEDAVFRADDPLNTGSDCTFGACSAADMLA